MKKFSSVIMTLALAISLVMLMSVGAVAAGNEAVHMDETVVSAQETEVNENDVRSSKAIAAAIVVAAVGAAGAIGMAMTISKSTESMARQPEMASKINSTMMLGIVFIETAIIYALVVAILIIFVL